MYKIFDLIPDTVSLRNLNPSQINYKVQLTESLVKYTTMTKGRITNVAYMSHDGDDVLSVSVAYNDSTGDIAFPLSRITTRVWFTNSGDNFNILGFDKTIKSKIYNPLEAIKEGQKRRNNIINNLFAMSAAVGKGVEASQQMKDHAPEILAYETMYDTSLITTIQNDNTHLWLTEAYPVDPTKTFRDVIVSGLTI